MNFEQNNKHDNFSSHAQQHHKKTSGFIISAHENPEDTVCEDTQSKQPRKSDQAIQQQNTEDNCDSFSAKETLLPLEETTFVDENIHNEEALIQEDVVVENSFTDVSRLQEIVCDAQTIASELPTSSEIITKNKETTVCLENSEEVQEKIDVQAQTMLLSPFTQAQDIKCEIDVSPGEQTIHSAKTGGQKMRSSAGEVFQIGDVIDHKYEIVDTLGRGGMGVVYKVRHTLMPETKYFALKILHFHLSQQQELKERFRREWMLAMEFQHQHALQIREYGEDANGHQYFTMDFSPGVPLRNLIDHDGCFAEKRALKITRQILEALHGAHRKGIIHRDLKPSNILIEMRDDEEHALVLDFGIAKALCSEEDAQLTQGFVGTPHYMSPEQAQGVAVDARSDLYTVGVILYEMLTNTKPFRGESTMNIVMARLNKKITPCREVNKDVSYQTAEVVEKAMHREAEKRYQNAKEFIAAIDAAMSEDLVMATASLHNDMKLDTIFQELGYEYEEPATTDPIPLPTSANQTPSRQVFTGNLRDEEPDEIEENGFSEDFANEFAASLSQTDLSFKNNATQEVKSQTLSLQQHETKETVDFCETASCELEIPCQDNRMQQRKSYKVVYFTLLFLFAICLSGIYFRNSLELQYWKIIAKKWDNNSASIYAAQQYYASKDYHSAYKWCVIAHQQGDRLALHLLISILQKQPALCRLADAAKWCHLAASLGNLQAMKILGDIYSRGENIAKNLTTATQWYEKAAKNGHYQAMYLLAQAYEKGKGIPQDKGTAAIWYQKSSAANVWILAMKATPQTQYKTQNYLSKSALLQYTKKYTVAQLGYYSDKWHIILKNKTQKQKVYFSKKLFSKSYIAQQKKQGYFLNLLVHGQHQWIAIFTKNKTTFHISKKFPRAALQAIYKKQHQLIQLAHINKHWVLIFSAEKAQQKCFMTTYFPRQHIHRYHDEGFHITQIAHGNGMWCAVMTKTNVRTSWHYAHYFPQEEMTDQQSKLMHVNSVYHKTSHRYTVMKSEKYTNNH